MKSHTLCTAIKVVWQVLRAMGDGLGSESLPLCVKLSSPILGEDSFTHTGSFSD